MKKIILALTIGAMMGSLGLSTLARADESIGEKTKATANDAGRAIKKGAHRAEEAVCAQSDTKCLAEKAKHRAEEAKDYSKDKASEIKNSVDKDDK